MKRHSLSRRVIKGGNFGSLNCKNEIEAITLDHIVDIPATDLYKDSSGECYHIDSLRQHIQTANYRGLKPTWPSGALVRQEIPRDVLVTLGLETFGREVHANWLERIRRVVNDPDFNETTAGMRTAHVLRNVAESGRIGDNFDDQTLLMLLQRYEDMGLGEEEDDD